MHNYILHPSNLRNRDNEINLRIEEGAQGYGIYIMILELLRDATNYRIANNHKMIAFAINHMMVDDISRIINNYNLFEISEDGYISSKWLTESLAEMDAKREKLSEAGKRGARAKQNRNKTENIQDQQQEEQSQEINKPPISQAAATLNQGTSISINKQINKQINESTNNVIVCDSGERLSIEVLDAICRGRDYTRIKQYDISCLPADGVERNTNILARLTSIYDLGQGDRAFICAVTDFCRVGGMNLQKILKIDQRMQQEDFKPKFWGSYVLKKITE